MPHYQNPRGERREPRPDANPDRVPPIASDRVDNDRKTFFLDLRENDRGKFITITERNGNHRDRIVVSVEAAGELAAKLGNLAAQAL